MDLVVLVLLVITVLVLVDFVVFVVGFPFHNFPRPLSLSILAPSFLFLSRVSSLPLHFSLLCPLFHLRSREQVHVQKGKRDGER
jgi:hypothetical protein